MGKVAVGDSKSLGHVSFQKIFDIFRIKNLQKSTCSLEQVTNFREVFIFANLVQFAKIAKIKTSRKKGIYSISIHDSECLIIQDVRKVV